MAIGSSIHVEKGVHLAFALILIVVHLWAHFSLLKFAGEAIEVSRGRVVLSEGVWQSCSSGSSSSFRLLRLFLFL